LLIIADLLSLGFCFTNTDGFFSSPGANLGLAPKTVKKPQIVVKTASDTPLAHRRCEPEGANSLIPTDRIVPVLHFCVCKTVWRVFGKS
jgi:hypothetical protein